VSTIGSQLADILIFLVQEGVVAMAVSVQAVVSTLKGEQHILAVPTSRLEVASPDGEVGEAGPDEIAGARQDVRSALQRPVVDRISIAGEWRDEQVSLLTPALTGNGDIEVRR
jgi:hypothetical protein